MRPLLLLSLSICVCFAACADHRGDLTAANAPQSPINQPDPGAIGSGPGSNTVEPPGGGANGGNGNGGTSGEGGNPGTGTEGSTPVPEPSTLLLVGSGLACAAMLRRRRQTPSA